jgi:hypothetical protein
MSAVFLLAFPEQDNVGVFSDAFPVSAPPPVLLAAALNILRDRLVLSFSEVVTGNTVPVLTFSGGAVTATFANIVGDTVRFTLSRTIAENETGSLTLSAGSYTSASSGETNSAAALSIAVPTARMNADRGLVNSLFRSRIVESITGDIVELN